MSEDDKKTAGAVEGSDTEREAGSKGKGSVRKEEEGPLGETVTSAGAGPTADEGSGAAEGPEGEATIPEVTEPSEGKDRGQPGSKDASVVKEIQDVSRDEPQDETVVKKSDESQEKEKRSGPPSKKKSSETDETKKPAEKDTDPLSDLEMFTRKQIVERLVSKHQTLVDKYKKELDEIDVRPPEIVSVKEGERSIRDTINEEVQTLKSKRKELRDANKVLRSEFFELLEKEEKLKGHRKEMEMYSNFSKDLEWKLETEAITIETERRLLDELKDTIDKMRSITDGYTPKEIKTRLNEIQEEIGTNLMKIEELHNNLLEKVEESNVHHEKYVDANKQIKERESRRGWLKRRIELHGEMETFWKTQMEQAEKLDGEESGRALEEIRTSLLEAFKEREKDEGQENSEPPEKPDRKTGKGRKGKGQIGGASSGQTDKASGKVDSDRRSKEDDETLEQGGETLTQNDEKVDDEPGGGP